MGNQSSKYTHTDSVHGRTLDLEPRGDGWSVTASDACTVLDVVFSNSELLGLRDHISKLGIPKRSHE